MQGEEDEMDMDGEEEYKPPSSRPSSGRGRKGVSKPTSSGGGRANGRASAANAEALAAATAAAVAAAGLEGLPPRMPLKTSALGTRSSSGGDGTDAADSANLAMMGFTGYEGFEGYDPAMFGLSGDLDGGDLSGRGGQNPSRQEKLKEKNRLAQRRFRARQKNQLEQMQARMDALNEQVCGVLG